MKREMIYQIQGGVRLVAQSRTQIAHAMYDISLAHEEDFESWLKQTARRIKVQFGHKVRYQSATDFILDLEKYKLITKLKGVKK
tara:strand:+ start:152 stop:403 length:252 start_codon:yes stop_codon:yes gene_type:complete